MSGVQGLYRGLGGFRGLGFRGVLYGFLGLGL